ncbi:ribonuclease H-like domain-containing protein [Tanacetum coccineum]
MEETLEQPFGLLEFRGFSSFNLQELVHVGNRVKSVVVNGITLGLCASSFDLEGNHHMINKIEFNGQWIKVIGLDVLKESCEKHGIGKSHFRCDTSLFIYRHGLDTAYLLLYVDDIVLTTSFSDLLQRIIRSLHQEFAMTDLGPLNYFLGVFVTRDSSGLFLSQKKYAIEILEKAHMVSCNPSRTPVDTDSKLGVDGDLVSDSTLYRSLAGSLYYFLHLSQFWSLISMRIGLVVTPLGDQLEGIVAKAEYRGVANAIAETCWLRNLLRELHTPLTDFCYAYLL